MPVVAITFHDKSVGWERNVNNVWGNLVLTFGRIAFFYKSGNHGRFEAADTGISFLSEKSITAPGTRPKAFYERGFDLTDLAAHFAHHFNLGLMEGVIFSNLCTRRLPIGAKPGATSGIVIRGYGESLSAFKTDLFNAWQSRVDVFIGAIRAGTRTIRAGVFGPGLHEGFATLLACTYGVFMPHAVVVAFTATKTLYAIFTICGGKFFAAMNAVYGGYVIMGLHVESPFDLPCHRTFAASRWRLFNYSYYTAFEL